MQFQSKISSSFKTASWITVAALIGLAGCGGTMPTMGGSSGNTVTGAAGGETSSGANSQLENCDETLGTLAVVEDQSAPWWHTYRRRYPTLGTTVPVLRMMIQQSNCFVVVERGRAMNNMMQERALMQSGEMREGSNFGKGQMVAADYTMNPSIQFSEKGTGGLGATVGGLLGNYRLGRLAGGVKSNEAATTLLLIDNRSGVQVSAAVGSAQNFDFNLWGGLFAGGGWGSVKGFTDTPEGKVVTAAFADSYNQMVRALRNYKAQTVKGGLGKGGRLKVSE
ncbi:MAG: CsgG/HfaB family protein [Candidatus Thiodiazotropha sp. (ex Ctena orbiculata)]|nr:CsgG/HfaB family protein [Candidatus Thiodiazotropha taylori]